MYKNEKEIEDVGDEDDDHLRQAEVVLQWGDQGSHRLPPQLLKSFSDSLLFFYAGIASQLIFYFPIYCQIYQRQSTYKDKPTLIRMRKLALQ